MRKFKILVFAFTLLNLNSSFAHKFYFAFAEIEYNVMQEKIEGTLIFTAHDLSDYLTSEKIISKDLEKLSHDSVSNNLLENGIFKNFIITYKNSNIELKIIDFFLTKNGLIEIYFTSEKIKLSQEIEIQFSTLMDFFPTQQNKITFIENNLKQTSVFLANDYIKTIKLQN
jgi:hypothetical protein